MIAGSSLETDAGVHDLEELLFRQPSCENSITPPRKTRKKVFIGKF